MNGVSSTTLLWVAIALPILIFLQHQVHRRLRIVFYLMTLSAPWSLYMYSAVLLPGVFLHELSHWVTAMACGVRTGRFSVMPRDEADGSVTLGYVEYYRTPLLDPLRESLIGGAPFIWGVTAVILIGQALFNTPQILSLLAGGIGNEIGRILTTVFSTPENFVLLYLLFAVSNSMIPSRSDRRAWPYMVVTLGIMVAVLYSLGGIPAAMNNFAPAMQRVLNYIAIAFSITIVLDVIAIAILSVLQGIVTGMTGRRLLRR